MTYKSIVIYDAAIYISNLTIDVFKPSLFLILAINDACIWPYLFHSNQSIILTN